ncbi:MAG TPA: MFS transporter [Candidatus Limnocylindria bacterium]|nr:MFS transporter [Candidatus Limnocylindria bacterium]
MSAKGWTLLATVLASGIVFLDSTVVNVALPRIGQELPSTVFGVLEGQSYVYTGYLLTVSALLILAGALTDYYGRKRMFAIGLAGFGITSVLCGLAPNMELLVLFRLLQGAAGAILVPGSLAIIRSTFEGEAQGRAFGLWAGASAGTTILGPFLGGILVDTVSWRAAFLINVPLVALALYATAVHVRETKDAEASGRFDWLGAFVAAVAVGGLSFGAIYGQQREWQDPLAFVALGLGTLATVALPFLMARRRDPLVPLSLFRSRNFSVTNLSTLLIYGSLYVTFYYQALFLQGTLGYSAAAAGLAGLPGGVLLTLLSTRFGALAGRYGPRLFMSAGPALMALGVLWFARVPSSSGAWPFTPGDASTYLPPPSYLADFLPGQVVFGLGLAMMVAPLTTALMSSVPGRYAGVASAVNNAISRVGPQLAGALIFIAITSSFYAGMAQRLPGIDTAAPSFRQAVSPLNRPKPVTGSVPQSVAERLDQIDRASREESTDAFHLAMLVSAGLLAAGAAVNAVGIRSERADPG